MKSWKKSLVALFLALLLPVSAGMSTVVCAADLEDTPPSEEVEPIEEGKPGEEANPNEEEKSDEEVDLNTAKRTALKEVQDQAASCQNVIEEAAVEDAPLLEKEKTDKYLEDLNAALSDCASQIQKAQSTQALDQALSAGKVSICRIYFDVLKEASCVWVEASAKALDDALVKYCPDLTEQIREAEVAIYSDSADEVLPQISAITIDPEQMDLAAMEEQCRTIETLVSELRSARETVLYPHMQKTIPFDLPEQIEQAKQDLQALTYLPQEKSDEAIQALDALLDSTVTDLEKAETADELDALYKACLASVEEKLLQATRTSATNQVNEFLTTLSDTVDQLAKTELTNLSKEQLDALTQAQTKTANDALTAIAAAEDRAQFKTILDDFTTNTAAGFHAAQKQNAVADLTKAAENAKAEVDKLTRIDDPTKTAYHDKIDAALKEGISALEATEDGNTEALAEALKTQRAALTAILDDAKKQDDPVTIAANTINRAGSDAKASISQMTNLTDQQKAAAQAKVDELVAAALADLQKATTEQEATTINSTFQSNLTKLLNSLKPSTTSNTTTTTTNKTTSTTSSNSPKTGDDTDLTWVLVVFLFSGCMVGLLTGRIIRARN